MSVIYPQQQQNKKRTRKQSSADNDENQNRKFLLRMVEELSLHPKDETSTNNNEQWQRFWRVIAVKSKQSILTNIYGFLWLVLKDMLRMKYFSFSYFSCCTLPRLIIVMNHNFKVRKNENTMLNEMYISMYVLTIESLQVTVSNSHMISLLAVVRV